MPKTSKKYAPGARSAVSRGIPVKVVDALIEVLAVEEDEITKDTRLADDLDADELDLVELGEQLGVEDECLDWVLVSDVLASVKKAGAQL